LTLLTFPLTFGGKFGAPLIVPLATSMKTAVDKRYPILIRLLVVSTIDISSCKLYRTVWQRRRQLVL